MAEAASVLGVALRACKLANDGTPLVGTKTAFTTNAFMRFGFTPEYTSGDEVEEKAANGSVCVYYQAPDVLKRVTISLAICNPSPELTEILVGGSLIAGALPADPALGYAAPDQGVDANPNGVALEVWSNAMIGGRPAPTNPFWRWVFPYAKLRFSGDRVLENGMMANEFEGWGVGNLGYATGAGKDWTYTTGKAFQYARVASAPTGTTGYFPITT